MESGHWPILRTKEAVAINQTSLASEIAKKPAPPQLKLGGVQNMIMQWYADS